MKEHTLRDSPRLPGPESTASLLQHARKGDEAARSALCARLLPRLRRWAHGRLPASARGLADTDDLVQVTLVRALNHIEHFEPRHEGSFLAYLRQILLNQIRDELRRAQRRPSMQGVDECIEDGSPSPVEVVIGRETLERYEHGLAELSPDQREAVILRVELGYSYDEMAEALGRPTANAARLVLVRALVRLAKEMRNVR